MSRPNIVWVHTDSHDGRVMGCMGHPAMGRATPNIDALASRGAMFRRFYSNNPICLPSRASMITSTYTYQNEAWNNYRGIPDDRPNLYTYFDQQGYDTAIIGKTDYLSGNHTIRARVSAWTRSAGINRPAYNEGGPEVLEGDVERVHERDWAIFDRGIAYLRQQTTNPERPFMLYLGPGIPHPKFVTSERYLRLIDEAGVNIPEQDDHQDHPVMAYNRMSKNWTHGFDPEMVKLTRRVYFAMVAELDAMMGMLMRAMDELGLWENTYLVFSSDHGEMALEHNNWYKMAMFEGAERVPFIAAGPGIVPGAATDNLASLIDVYPTLLDMAGLPKPEGLVGQSLLPELRGQPSSRQDWVLSEYHDTTAMTGMIMLCQGHWKYIAYPGYRPQLFDLAADPDELHDLAAKRPEVVARMDAKLREIVDYEAVDAKVKAYDKRAFRRWRQEQKGLGTYEKNMALVYSGWDEITPEMAQPWTEEDERRVVAWMNDQD